MDTGGGAAVNTKYNDLLKQIQRQPLLVMGTDRMICRYGFETPYSAHFPSRDDWKTINVCDDGNNEIWFTDGSKTQTVTGAGAFCPSLELRLSFPLGRHATVFQAEVYAILVCGWNCLERGLVRKTIKVFSDSQAAL